MLSQHSMRGSYMKRDCHLLHLGKIVYSHLTVFFFGRLNFPDFCDFQKNREIKDLRTKKGFAKILII